MKHKRATWLLILAFAVPAPAPADGFEDMFSIMMRMMFAAMRTMANMADEGDWGSGWGGNRWSNPWGAGMSPASTMLWPGSGFGGMSPWSGLGMSPWSGVGMSPWSGMGGWPGSGLGLTPWNSAGGWPGSGFNTTPWGGAGPWNGGSVPWTKGIPGGVPVPANTLPTVALLDGRWYGNTGEILEIHGNRFRLRNPQATVKGSAVIENNLLKLYTPQTNTMTVYSFVRNQTGLILQDTNGNTLVFQQNPVTGIRGPVTVF